MVLHQEDCLKRFSINKQPPLVFILFSLVSVRNRNFLSGLADVYYFVSTITLFPIRRVLLSQLDCVYLCPLAELGRQYKEHE